MRYVTRCRMHHASRLLASSNASVAAIAAQVGYESEAAFSWAFKRVIDATPRGARDRDPQSTKGLSDQA